MNWLDREILGLRRQDKIGAPKYYENPVNPGWGKPVLFNDYYGPTSNPVGDRWYNPFHDNVRPKHFTRDELRNMDQKTKDTNSKDKIQPEVTKPEDVDKGKPVEQTPADPKPAPGDWKVDPRDVSPRPEVPGNRER